MFDLVEYLQDGNGDILVLVNNVGVGATISNLLQVPIYLLLYDIVLGINESSKVHCKILASHLGLVDETALSTVQAGGRGHLGQDSFDTGSAVNRFVTGVGKTVCLEEERKASGT